MVTISALHEGVRLLLQGRDLTTTTIRTLRHDLEGHLHLPVDALEPRKDELQEIIKSTIFALTSKEQAEPAEEDDLGEEPSESTRRQVYLVTFPHTLAAAAADGTLLRPPGDFSREEIAGALQASMTEAQRSHSSAHFLLIVVFQEKHANGFLHYHAAVKGNKQFRFLEVKLALLRKFGMASHWSTSHDGYASAVAYGYMPSQKKPLAVLDPTPLVWACAGEHPPLAEASRAPVSAAALAARRENSRKARSEIGLEEQRFQEVDIWPIVVSQNFAAHGCGREQLMAYAKRCGGPAMTKFCFVNWNRLEDLIARAWQAEQVEVHVEEHGKSRLDLLQAAALAACCCGGRWGQAAAELFERNGLDSCEWAASVLNALRVGRQKGNVVCHAGLEGDEGKSFLLEPLAAVFGADSVFTTPSRSSFPLLGLESCRVALLDDWRFNEDVVPFNVQLLWFESKPFVISRPQNQFTGHLRYGGDAPVFITTLEADITKVKAGLQSGDIEMMVKRLKIFRFHAKVVRPDRSIPACGACFAKLVLCHSGPRGSAAGQPSTSHSAALCAAQAAELASTSSGFKREASGHTGCTPDAKRASYSNWSVNDVVQYLRSLELGHLEPAFRHNAVDGAFLVALSEEELVAELGLTRMQSKKILLRLPR